MDEKLQKKLAKQQAKEQQMIQIRKDTLAREGALDEITLNKIKDKWLDAVIDTKVPEMQDNLRHVLHYMEKLIEAENYRKILFEDERQELEEKSKLIAQSHRSALETLFDIYQKRIQDLHNAYNENVTARKNRAQEEFKAMEDKEKETQDNMNTMLFQKQLNREKDEEMMNCDMFLKLDDERSKNTEKQEYLRSKLEKKMEKRWGEITTTLSKYDENTKLRKKEYDQLKAKDDAESKIIYRQMKKTQKLFEQLEELKNCMEESYAPKETISLIADLREERMKFFSTFKELKHILANELKDDQRNLKNLTVTTNSLISLHSNADLTPKNGVKAERADGERIERLIQELRDISNKGEQILTMYRICQRLETQYEKIVPVGGSFNIPKQAEGIKNKKAKTDNIEEMIITYHDSGNWAKNYEVLGKFWEKVAAVHLSKLALQKCIESMESENKLLHKVLASYMRDFSAKK